MVNLNIKIVITSYSIHYTKLYDGSGTNTGWDATVICSPPPSCPQPTNVTVSGIGAHEAVVTWVEQGSAVQWEVIILPAGAPSPLPSDSGIIVGSYNFV